jgi:hypothetical protein
MHYFTVRNRLTSYDKTMSSDFPGRRDGGTRINLCRLGSEGESGGSIVSSDETAEEEGRDDEGSRTFPL